MKWLEILDDYTGERELVNIEDIKRIGRARDHQKTIIRFKSGGYGIYREPFEGRT